MIAGKRPRPRKRERKGPAAERGGEVRDSCRQWALNFPILLRFATPDGPLSSPASQETTKFRKFLTMHLNKKDV